MDSLINLLENVLAQGRRLYQQGHFKEARRRLDKLLAYPEVPVSSRVEAHEILAEIYFELQCYRKARRHLLAALGLQPTKADLNYRLAHILANDTSVDPRKSVKYYRRAIELEPDVAHYWSGYGQVCVRLGWEKAARGAFIAAADLAPINIDTIDEIADGLCFLGRAEDARLVLIAARFRLGHSTEMEQLWSRFQFLKLYTSQQKERRRKAREAHQAVILPFVPGPVAQESARHPGILRFDRSSTPAPHNSRKPGKSSDPRRL